MLVGLSAGYLIAMASAWLGLALSLLAFISFKGWRAKGSARRIAARGFLALWALTLAAVAAETTFSFAYDTTDSFRLAKTSERWYVRHVTNNNWGFRDARKFTPTPEAGIKRIVVVGDSFAFDHGVTDVKQRFGERLERYLNNSTTPPAKFEVYTAARPGADTAECRNILKELFGRGLHCDLVLMLYNLNDIETLVPETNAVVMGSILCSYPSESNLLLRELYLPNFLYYRYQQFQRPEVRDYFGWLADAHSGPAFAQQVERLDSIVTLVRENGAKFAFCIFPLLHDLSNYRFNAAHERLQCHWAAKNVAFLDLLPTMQGRNHLVVNRYDAHPNDTAHDLAAEAAAAWLRPLFLSQ